MEKQEFNWGNVFTAIGATAVVLTAGILLLFTINPHEVDGYYLSQGSNNRNTSTCVYAHWTWHPDEIVFCTDDVYKAVDVVGKLQQGATK